MNIAGEPKYVVLMVREEKRNSIDNVPLNPDYESFRFLTIYDPKSATDYQCGVKEGCDLHKVLIGETKTKTDSDSDSDSVLSKYFIS